MKTDTEKRKTKLNICFLNMVVSLFLLCGCGGAEAPIEKTAPIQRTVVNAEPLENNETEELIEPEEVQKKDGDYEVPEYRGSWFNRDASEGNGNVRLDLSSVSLGYIAVSVNSDTRIKFQVIKDGETYTYNVAKDGTPSVFPLQSGDGYYVFRVMQNIVDSKYAEIYHAERSVTIPDQFDPFLRPSDYINYSEESDCVAKAAEIASECDTALDVIDGVYAYICKTVKYDRELAKDIPNGYLPDVDSTMKTGKGICFDYASLAAAMLRSQGIPTKVIFGYVSPNDVYHAWNMIYTEETGWIAVKIQVSENDWNRFDLTFSANGADADFIGNGDHYSEVYQY